jgi:hypothetical protein
LPDITPETVFTILPDPGIKRDGTGLDSDNCSDGQWVRFQRGRAKKIGGYRRITSGLATGVTKVLTWANLGLVSIFNMSSSKIETVQVNTDLVGASVFNRTPAGFVTNADNIWSADTQYDDAVGSKNTIVVAHCSQSLSNIDDTTTSKPYWALADGSTLFQSITDAPAVSGGVFCLPPYTCLMGSNGDFHWSDANQPQVWEGSTNPGDAGGDRITGAKLVKGFPLQAGRLAAILWSLDSVIRMDYVGGAQLFSFSTITTKSSVLSQNSIIEYDNMFFWIGMDRFLYFDSTVNELPNQMNLNWFFNNLNYTYRQKVWAMKNTKFGEIWWFFPFGDSTECNHAIIFNIREKTWYDCSLTRAAGMYSALLRFPVAATTTGELYQHEYGYDAIVGDAVLPIQSYFTTQNFGYPTGGVGTSQQGMTNWTRLTRVEPDFLQTGTLNLSVLSQEFARSPIITAHTQSFSDTAERLDMRVHARHIQLKWESNETGGYYEAGRVIVHTELGDVRN